MIPHLLRQVLCVAFDPRGDFLASSSADGTVRIWDLRDEPKTIKTINTGIRVHPGSAQMMRIAWHPTGEGLAVPHGAGVEVLERETWEIQSKLRGGHIKEVSLIAWCENGRYLCTAGLDKQLFLWDLSSAESLDRHKVCRPLTPTPPRACSCPPSLGTAAGCAASGWGWVARSPSPPVCSCTYCHFPPHIPRARTRAAGRGALL